MAVCLILLFSSINIQAQLFAPGGSTTNVSCPGGNDGEIIYSLLGNGPLTYIWSDQDTGVTLGGCTFEVVLNNTGAPQTDFQIPVRLGLGANMNPDFSDVVFLDAAGNAYSFWLQNYPVADTATFWVLIPNIPSGSFSFFLSFCGTSTTSASDPWATFDFFDDFDDGDVSDWTAGCERNTTSGEYCNQGVSTRNWSPGYSMTLLEHGSCFISPYNGAASTMSKTVTLTNYDYVLEMDDSFDVQLFSYCSGGTNGRNGARADGVNIGNASGAGRSGSCGHNGNGWNYYTSNYFNVSTGTVNITLFTTGGDCAESTGWMDDVRIRRWSPDPINVTLDSAGFITKSNLTAGTYVVQVTDVAGNVFYDSITITEPPAIVANEGSIDPACAGASNGSAFVAPTGGNTGTYSVLWSTGDMTDTVYNLAAGTYTVTITDVMGCADTSSVIINAPVGGLSLVSTSLAPLCANTTDGIAVVTPNGGTPNYNYLWSTGDMTDTVTGLASGPYTVTVTDNNGCVDSATVTVGAAPQLITINTSTTDEACVGASNGQAIASASGGSGMLYYTWDTGDMTDTLTGLTAGTYTVSVVDDNGCTDSASITIVSQPNSIVLLTTTIDATCNGSADGEAVVNASGGTGNFTYAWSNGSTIDTASGLSVGGYMVTVTDGNGCLDSTSATIDEPDAIDIAFLDADASCMDGSNGALYTSVTGGTMPYVLLWSNGADTEQPDGLSVGDYTLTVTDDNGCVDSLSASVPADSMNVAIEVLPDTLVQVGEAVTLTAISDNSIDALVWTSNVLLTDSTMETITTVPTDSVNSYTVTVVGDNGCEATETIIIYTEGEETLFYIPTAFSPNGDGINDVFRVESSSDDIVVVWFRVFDRWGEQVFVGDNTTMGWDGTHKGQRVAPDVYVYDIRVKVPRFDKNGQLFPSLIRKSGSITVVR